MEEINRQMAIMDMWGLDISKPYTLLVRELMDRHQELLQEKFRREKDFFRETLYNIVKNPN